MSTPDMQLAPAKEEQQRALRVVLESAIFAKNPRLAALLRYLCFRSFRGENGSIKEYSIATDVFGRAPDFDQSTDAIVRVEMHRLRKKLREFYAGEGAHERIQIVIQNGHYMPEFVLVEPVQQASATDEQSNNTSFEAELASTEWKSSLGVTPAVQRPATNRIQWKLWVLVCGLLALTLTISVITVRRVSSTRASSVYQTGGVLGGDTIRILCGYSGGNYRDRRNDQWAADAFFSGGTVSDSGAPPIYRTRDQCLFRTARSGEFSYKIPLKPGTYELRLYFADTSYSPGPAMEGGENVRIFNVLLNGKLALRNFDIINEAGPNTADVRVFKDVQPEPDGYLYLATSKLVGEPLLNAIEILPGVPHHLRPIRIVTQDGMLIDRAGVLWSPDNFFLGGRTIARYGTVIGPDDPLIYERERYGNFSYAIPVPAGHYTVTLHFAETYWGPQNPGGGGAGSRVFDVYCNGTTLLNNFDMFSEAGSHRQIIRTFRGLEPNAQGTLLLNFVPVTNYANLSAIEVLDES